MDDLVPQELSFDVVENGIHRVMLGNSFPQTTQSLTVIFANRFMKMDDGLGKHIMCINNIGTIHQRLR